MALDVALDVMPADDGDVVLRVNVGGGTVPLRVSVYLDGALAGAWDSVCDVYEFRAASLAGRRTLTVRAVDAEGCWGGASTLLAPGHAARAGDEVAPPRVTLRSTLRTRQLQLA